MPLERILGLEKIVDEEELEREKRKTWRGGANKEDGGAKVENWTTGEVMEGWALERGFRESSYFFRVASRLSFDAGGSGVSSY